MASNPQGELHVRFGGASRPDPSSWWAQWETDIRRMVSQSGRPGEVATMVERQGVLWIGKSCGDVYSARRVGAEGFELRLESTHG